MPQVPLTAPPGGTPQPQGPEKPSQGTPAWVPGKPMEFLGMKFSPEEAGRLWQAVIQLVSREIEKDKENALKALRKLREDQEQQ